MSDIEEILNEFVKEKYTQERKDLSRVIYSKFQAKQQTIDKLTKEVDIQTKFKEAYLGHWQDSKDEVCKLTKEVEELREEKDALRIGYNEVMGETLEENTKLKEQLKECESYSHSLKMIIKNAYDYSVEFKDNTVLNYLKDKMNQFKII